MNIIDNWIESNGTKEVEKEVLNRLKNMKVLLKNLPTEKELRIYYQNMFDINQPQNKLNILRVHKTGNFITMTIEYKEDISFVTSFYQRIDHINTKNKYFSLTIDKEHYQHVNTNFNINNDYFKERVKEL